MKPNNNPYADRRRLAQAYKALERALAYVRLITYSHDEACACPLCNTAEGGLRDAVGGLEQYAAVIWKRELSQIISYAGGQLAKGGKP